MMKTYLSLICLIFRLLTISNNYAQSIDDIFICKKGLDFAGIEMIESNFVLLPKGNQDIFLANENMLIIDTIQVSPTWGGYQGALFIKPNRLAISFMNHGLELKVEKEKMQVLNEIPAKYEAVTMGMKTTFSNFILGVAIIQDPPKKHSIYQYTLVDKRDTSIYRINTALPKKSKYYSGMSSLTDYHLLEDDLVINYSEANVILLFNLKTFESRYIELPEVMVKNKESWYLKVDTFDETPYLIRSSKKKDFEIYHFSLATNKLVKVHESSNKPLVFRKGSFYYRNELDGENCLFVENLNKNKTTETIILNEVIIK